MPESKSHLQDADPLADARVWLAHMEQTLARLAAEHALKKIGPMAATPPKAPEEHDRSFPGIPSCGPATQPGRIAGEKKAAALPPPLTGM